MDTKIQKRLALIMVILLVVGSIYYFESMKASPMDYEESEQKFEGAATEVQADKAIPEELRAIIEGKESKYIKAPELAGIEGYLNTDPNITIESLRGKVVLIDFWTYTCINCIRTLPYLTAWDKKYREDGLVIIGVHTPEFQFEKKYENVQDAINKYGVKYPVVQDNNYATWKAYKNRFWPHKYLIDIDGFIRYDHIGEGRYQETEDRIVALLNEKKERYGEESLKKDETEPENVVDIKFGQVGTPEIYFGYKFARGNFGNQEGLQKNVEVTYSIPKDLKPNRAYLEGTWQTNEDGSVLLGDKGRIVLPYDAKVVNIVAEADPAAELEVLIDGEPLDETQQGTDTILKNGKTTITIDQSGLYNLVDYEYNPHVLELKINGKGFEIFTFTFG